ncbi:hypothetical protein J3A83DRAFT_4190373 [Scleroderma citrinum]
MAVPFNFRNGGRIRHADGELGQQVPPPDLTIATIIKAHRLNSICITVLVVHTQMPPSPTKLSKRKTPYAKFIIGVDIGQDVVDMYNCSTEEENVSSDERRARASYYRHLESILDVTKVLVPYLKPGESLLVANFIKAKYLEEMFPTRPRSSTQGGA